jgi:hypothetical protein
MRKNGDVNESPQDCSGETGTAQFSVMFDLTCDDETP